MKQLKFNLPTDLRTKLDAASSAAGRSLANEIRDRLERSFEDDAIDPRTRALMNEVKELAELVREDTGYAWHSHGGAVATLSYAILTAMTRILAPFGTDEFAPGDLPTTRLVASEDPMTIGTGIEAYLRLKLKNRAVAAALTEIIGEEDKS